MGSTFGELIENGIDERRLSRAGSADDEDVLSRRDGGANHIGMA